MRVFSTVALPLGGLLIGAGAVLGQLVLVAAGATTLAVGFAALVLSSRK